MTEVLVPEFPEKTWLLDRHELFGLYSPDLDQPFPVGTGIRVNPRAAGATGYRDFLILEDGLAVIASDVQFSQVVSLEHPDRPLIKFHYRLSGGGSIDFDQSGVRKIAEHRGSVLYMPALHRKRETALPGKHELSVTIATTPEWLRTRFGRSVAEASPHLEAYAKGAADDFFCLPITMRAAISHAAGALLQTELTGDLRRVFFEAKALEILSQSLDVLINERAFPEYTEHRISKHDFEQLRDARRILQTEFNLGFKIGELAHRLGMNESRMMHLFKRLYGETVFDFAQRVRMEYAAKLLEATERSITDIAYEVGYDYPSNFTTAFKRHFGIPPRAVRKVGSTESVRA